jgi:5-aminolevulinate synthase
MPYIDTLERKINDLKTEGRYRYFTDLERCVGDAPYAYWHHGGARERVVVWCTNDYLGMSHHPEVINAMKHGAEKFGAGSGGTRNISGTAHPHVLLESKVADLHEKESALLFSSGYVANEATLSTLGDAFDDCVLISDEKNHASMIQGMRHSKATRIIFKHNDMEHLESILKNLPLNQPKIIAFISVYSMDGDWAKIAEIINLAKKYNALTYMDEVHAVGIYGPGGAGLGAKLELHHDIDIIQGNFAKAYGVIGGYIAGNNTIIDYVRSHASGFIFTTSIPPCVALAAAASISVLRQDDTIRNSLWERVAYFKKQLAKTNVTFHQNESHIVPVIVGDAKKCKLITDILRSEYKLYAQPINYPTVPRGTERMRLTVTPHHTMPMIDDMVSALNQIWRELALKATG